MKTILAADAKVNFVKVPVFGLFKRNDSVYACIISDARANTSISIIRKKVKPDNIIYTDSLESYNAIHISEFTHRRVNHTKEFVQDKKNINGIENFWNQAKCHICKYDGIPKEPFHLFQGNMSGLLATDIQNVNCIS